MSVRPLPLFVHSDTDSHAGEESLASAPGRISAEEASRLLTQLESGECTCLGPQSGTELLREVLFLRRQVQKIKSVSDSPLVHTLTQTALYGVRQ